MQDFPAGDLPNAQGLVSAAWLHRAIEHARHGAPAPPGWGGGHLVVAEAGWGPLSTHDRGGHIPGSIHLDTDTFETPGPAWRLRTLAEICAAIGAHGIRADSTVVVHGQPLIAAARIWWILHHAGVADVRLLDGGFAAWSRAHLPATATLADPVPVRFEGEPRRDVLATTDEVSVAIDGGAWLGDVRSAAEYAGIDSGYWYIDARGRVPGALALGDADDAAGRYQRADGCMRDPRHLLGEWQAAGIRLDASGKPARELIFYCGNGWRSSLAFFHAWLLGFDNIRNYSDGWSGWSTVYLQDPLSEGSTPGWRQLDAGNPVVR